MKDVANETGTNVAVDRVNRRTKWLKYFDSCFSVAS